MHMVKRHPEEELVSYVSLTRCAVPITLFVQGMIIKLGGATNQQNVIGLIGGWLVLSGWG
jgi:hypothetical protein